MRVTQILVFLGVSIFLTGCVTTSKPAMTPLEIQSLQSREYKVAKEVVFPSVISVFQDIGYTITNADIQTGLISAESSSNSNSISKFRLGSISKFRLGMTQVSQTKATAFVEQIGKKTRARLNFVEINRTSSKWGQTDRWDTPILDAKIYENAFEKIESAIFVRTAH